MAICPECKRYCYHLVRCPNHPRNKETGMPTPLYIFDLDGTLANGDHRLEHIVDKDPKDWDTFFSLCGYDEPIWHTIRLFQALQAAGNDVWIWTGRSDMVADKTLKWLADHCIACETIKMRRAHDHTNDDVLKEQWLQALSVQDRARLHGVFEDRNRVVEMWRRNGVPCFHVADGAF